MKQFVYVLTDEDMNVVAIYTREDVAKKMKPVIERKLETTVEIDKTRLDPDIKTINR